MGLQSYIAKRINKFFPTPELPADAPKVHFITVLEPDAKDSCIPFWANERAHTSKTNVKGCTSFDVVRAITANVPKYTMIAVSVDGWEEGQILQVQERLTNQGNADNIFFYTENKKARDIVATDKIPTVRNIDVSRMAGLTMQGILANRFENPQKPKTGLHVK